jgi:predicted RNase H-like HicB family nuclease
MTLQLVRRETTNNDPAYGPIPRIETEHEDDGRWIAEIPDLPGVLVYGASRDEAVSRVKALALRALADL